MIIYNKYNLKTNFTYKFLYEYLDKNKNKLKDKRILFYCAHGHRSTLAVQISKSYNFTNCCHLIGGIENWKKEGLGLSECINI
jgi:rhodanese-related sulfurtransferase